MNKEQEMKCREVIEEFLEAGRSLEHPELSQRLFDITDWEDEEVENLAALLDEYEANQNA